MAKISFQALHSCVKGLEESTKALIAEALFGQAQVEIQLVVIFCFFVFFLNFKVNFDLGCYQ